jgi:quercetin dioxygenase-like cupin family protein
MSYTKLNLHDAEDLAEKHGFGHIQEARFAWRELDTEQTGLSHQRIKPGQRGFPHRHQQAEEVYVVLAGSGRVKLDEEVERVKLLDAIRVSPGVVRAFEAGDDGLELLAFGPRRENDAEMVRDPGFWD